LDLIDSNEALCCEINKDLCIKVVERLKNSKYLDLENIDIVEEFTHILSEQLVGKYTDYTGKTTRINSKTGKPSSTNCCQLDPLSDQVESFMCEFFWPKLMTIHHSKQTRIIENQKAISL
jgi:hypothetical protein